LFKPAALLLFSPFAITVNHLDAAAPGKQPAHGIHLAEHFPDLRFSVMLLPVAMGYEITDKMFPCGIPAFSLPATAAGHVVHKINDHITGRDIHQPAQHQKRFGKNKLIGGMAGISTGLPPGLGDGGLLLESGVFHNKAL